MKPQFFPTKDRGYSVLVLVSLAFTLLVAPAAAADAYIEAELGDTINLHGVSYIGESVYLFLTGPGLPENGVMLTDVSRRADQGHFTIIDLASDQTWAMKWDTSRIENEIDPGTYYVYVTNEPVDKANLGGTSSYKTLEVYLERSTTSRVSVNSGQSYMLYPEKDTPTPVITIVLNTPRPASATKPTSEAPTPTPQPPPSSPTTRASVPPALPLIALLGAVVWALRQ
jgi:hypothetical protein